MKWMNVHLKKTGDGGKNFHLKKKQVRRVKAGEELTCDYGYDPNNQVILYLLSFILYQQPSDPYHILCHPPLSSLSLQQVPQWFRCLWEKEQGTL